MLNEHGQSLCIIFILHRKIDFEVIILLFVYTLCNFLWSDFETDSETSAEVRNCLSKFCLLLLKLLFNWIMTDFFCKCRLDCLLFWLPLLVHNWNLFWRILVHNCKKFCYFTLQYHGLRKFNIMDLESFRFLH